MQEPVELHAPMGDAQDPRYVEELATFADLHRARLGFGGEEVRKGLHTLRRILGPDAKMYVWSPLAEVPLWKPFGLTWPQLVRLGGQLYNLSRHDGFERLVAKLHNSSQFQSTMFEIEVADWFASLPTFELLRFDPEVEISGRKRRPDMLAVLIGREVYVECKLTSYLVSKAREQIESISHLFLNILEDLGGCPPPHRIEVVVREPVRGNLVLEATRLVKALLANPEDGQVMAGADGALLGTVSTQGVPARLATDRPRYLALVANATPRRLCDGNAYAVFSFPYLARREVRPAGKLLQEALHQLPLHKTGVIALGVNRPENGVEAALRRIAAQEYSKVLFIAVWGSGPPILVTRPDEEVERTVTRLINGPI